MRLTEIDYRDTPPVEGYGPGFFRIGGEVIRGGLLVLPGLRRGWEGYGDLADILDRAEGLDVLLLGTGAEMAYLPAALKTPLEAAGIGVEPMASPSACRAYNVLLSEGRRIGLAALAV
ncbi:Mth938-like domain-containing protein [Mangrovicoccus algicola]|uniref:Mth938-like domain-containing protein n=1 Tax=Mangrovicoccus algicola TaxID=2771008 RepID=A0A8J6YT53_9RHOB|nr:Mth938-like domain-containing protein [Mangrovicoccus algicola]MBE3637150.1 Mth938-like domain-containing protein [Mangrovicoccus algicola]